MAAGMAARLCKQVCPVLALVVVQPVCTVLQAGLQVLNAGQPSYAQRDLRPVQGGGGVRKLGAKQKVVSLAIGTATMRVSPRLFRRQVQAAARLTRQCQGDESGLADRSCQCRQGLLPAHTLRAGNRQLWRFRPC